MIRLKRFFIVKKHNDFGHCKQPSPVNVKENINNEVDFMGAIDHEDMENLVKGNIEPSTKYSEYYEYIKQLDNPTILQDEKEIISEFASHIIMEEISVKSIDSLHKKKRKSNKVEPVTIMTEESKDETETKPQDNEYPCLDSTTNILGIKWSERVSKMIWQHISKYSKTDERVSKHLVSIVHYWVPQNKLSYDSYYIVKNIIYSILNKCPEILSFFKLIDLDINVDIFFNDSETIKRDYTEIFIRFIKKLRELKLDYNILVCISQADCTYIKNNLLNFIFLLRQAIKYMPPYLKFVLTFTGDSIIEQDEISRILLLTNNTEASVNNEIHLTNRDLFTKYGEVVIDTLNISQSASKETILQKWDNDFERILDSAELQYLAQNESDMVKEFDCKLANFLMKQMKDYSDSAEITQLLRVLWWLKMPISTHTLAQIWQISESTLSKMIQNNFKNFVWVFHKKIYSKIEDFEEQKGIEEDYEIDTTEYVCINSPNLCTFDNAIDVHNDIVRVLRKQPIDHYILFCMWYHISEWDEDYTTQYMEEEENTLEASIDKPESIGDDPEDKAKGVTFFDLYYKLFNSQCIYKFIEYHKGFEYLITELGFVISSSQTDIIEKERTQLLNFRNILYLIEHTILNEKLCFADFCAQLRGRLIGEEEKSLMHKLRMDITNQRFTYFKGFQNSLRENAKIETVFKFPFSVNKTCLFTDQRRIAIYSDSGLIYIWSIDFEIISVISCPYPEIEWCQFFSQQIQIGEENTSEIEIEEEDFLFTAGNDPYIRKWDIASQREIAHYQWHKTDCTIMTLFYEYLFSTGSDKRLVKFNIEKERIDKVYKSKEKITAIRILDNIEDRDASKILISTLYGYLELLDFDLVLISSLSVPHPNEFIVSLVNHSLSEFLSFSKDGQITVYEQETLNIIKEESILNLKSDDYLDLILIRSKEYILFTLEKQKMDFFTWATFKKTDSWDYFFEHDLHHWEQNFEGSKILVSDKGGFVTLFNFLRNADPNSKGMQLSCNRRNDPVSCLEITNGLDQDKIVSCSNDRDLRIWKKTDGVFCKKYDLSSFTNESITSMCLGKDQNMLFLGSKDMNVYLIDIGRGKLWVVYEGHWNKVNIIYTIPERDILITVSESNIKVWDLEYDECIKNMNDHESSIIHVSQYEQKSQQHILTIGSNFEMRMWNYETGEDSKEHKLNIDRNGKVKNVVCACTFEQQLFLATNKNILIYSMDKNMLLHEFKAYNSEQVIDLFAYKVEGDEYLVVTTRTSCTVYTLEIDELQCSVVKLWGYYINAKKRSSNK